MNGQFELWLNSPLTEEQWDALEDVDFEYTTKITFTTKHGKQVTFYKGLNMDENTVQSMPDSTSSGVKEGKDEPPDYQWIVQRWIPISESMPEEHDSIFAKFKGTPRWNKYMFEKMSDKVIVTSELEDGKRIVEPAYTVDGRWSVEVKAIRRKIIAWCPLPTPYRKDGENE